jgi:integrase
MGREINRLSARAVATLKKPGRHADGAGLYLSISPPKDGGEGDGAKRWVFLFKRGGKAREMGLGGAQSIGLAAARSLAESARSDLSKGLDPIAERKKRVSEVECPTFEECATQYIDDNRAGWRNAKHAGQWTSTLKAYAYPVLGKLKANEITTEHIAKVLNPIWTSKTETASRVRSRVEAVLDWAKVKGYRHGENPARWRGHLDQILPKRSKVQRVKHHPALPYQEMGGFMSALREQGGVAALALEFTILTAARTNETTGAKLAEFSEAGVWVVPPERMKAEREHRVPLSPRSVQIVKDAKLLHGSRPDAKAPLFLGNRRDRHLSNGAMLALLERMGRGDITVHGFRSTFRDWAAESTNFPNQVVEMALAHVIEDKSEAAYRRGDLFKKRAALMAAWEAYCLKGAGKVVPMARGGKRPA